MFFQALEHSGKKLTSGHSVAPGSGAGRLRPDDAVLEEGLQETFYKNLQDWINY